MQSTDCWSKSGWVSEVGDVRGVQQVLFCLLSHRDPSLSMIPFSPSYRYKATISSSVPELPPVSCRRDMDRRSSCGIEVARVTATCPLEDGLGVAKRLVEADDGAHERLLAASSKSCVDQELEIVEMGLCSTRAAAKLLRGGPMLDPAVMRQA